MAHWILKTEPSEYASADLVRDKRTVWSGVSNALALKHLRTFAAGDHVLVYHTGGEKAVVGMARVRRGPYPDPKADDERLVVVDVEPVRALPQPVTLADFKADAKLSGTDLVRLPRLSVIPLTKLLLERDAPLAPAAVAPVLAWVGVALAWVAAGFTVWARFTLGRWFSGTFALRPDHALVTHGPYAIVRHPMYTGLVA
ncbi:MAG: EVE domain-containing protein, partial [bacterium]